MTVTLVNTEDTSLRLKPCVRCGRMTQSQKASDQYPVRCGRDLCGKCYHIVSREGTREDYPRHVRSRAEVLEDWRILRARGMTLENGFTRADIAAAMGMTRAALDQALVRARRAGEAVA